MGRVEERFLGVVGGRKGYMEGGGEEQEGKYKKGRRKIVAKKVRFTSRTGFCTNSVSSLLKHSTYFSYSLLALGSKDCEI